MRSFLLINCTSKLDGLASGEIVNNNVAAVDSIFDVFVALSLLGDSHGGSHDDLFAFFDEATRSCHLFIPRMAEHARILLAGIIAILKHVLTGRAYFLIILKTLRNK